MRFSETHIARAFLRLMQEGQSEKGEVVRDFVAFLRRRHLFRQSDRIIAAVEQQLDAEEGKLPITVTSARALGQAEEKKVGEKICELFPGKKCEITYRENPELIGGLRIETADIRYDATVRRSLRLLAQSL